jgi:hypothetical protein
MTLNLPLLYVLWLEEFCRISPYKNKSPNLWHITSILVCCIFAITPWNELQKYLKVREICILKAYLPSASDFFFKSKNHVAVLRYSGKIKGILKLISWSQSNFKVHIDSTIYIELLCIWDLEKLQFFYALVF